MRQKFLRGDLVWIGDMPDTMRHFDGNCNAIIVGSYEDLHFESAGSEIKYAVRRLPSKGFSAWYPESLLTKAGSYWTRDLGEHILQEKNEQARKEYKDMMMRMMK